MNEIHRCGNTWMYCDGDCANCTLNSIDANSIKNETIGDGVIVLEERPIFDVVPVVRCKECKHYLTGGDGFKYCHKHDDDILWHDDDFCSYGERSEDA